ncbi:hypothetical protein D3C79_729230 [compost metagenome]
MLILCRQAAIFGFHRPAVFHGADAIITGVDHGLNGEGHTGLQHHAAVIGIVMQYLRLFVETFADAVAAIFAHYGELLCFNKLLDGFTQSAQANTWLDHLQGQIQALLGDAAQALAQNGRFADDEHLGGVAVEAVFDHGHVDIDDIPVFQHLVVTWDAVAHHFVHRDTDRFWEAVVAQAGRDRLLFIGDMLVTDPVQLAGGDAGFNVGLDDFQHFCGQAARNAHLLNVIRCFN